MKQSEDEVEEFLSEDHLAAVEELDSDLYKVDEILDDTYDDLDQLGEFLNLLSDAKPERDDKLKALIKLLKTDSVLKKEKVIIFTEFADTARYLEHQLGQAGLDGICRIDGGSSQKQRSDVIRRFSPYYNETSFGRTCRRAASRKSASSSPPTSSPKVSTCRTPRA